MKTTFKMLGGPLDGKVMDYDFDGRIGSHIVFPTIAAQPFARFPPDDEPLYMTDDRGIKYNHCADGVYRRTSFGQAFYVVAYLMGDGTGMLRYEKTEHDDDIVWPHTPDGKYHKVAECV